MPVACDRVILSVLWEDLCGLLRSVGYHSTGEWAVAEHGGIQVRSFLGASSLSEGLLSGTAVGEEVQAAVLAEQFPNSSVDHK